MKQVIPWHVCVLIPAFNEEVLLPRCLNSVIHACTQLSCQVTADIVLVDDESTDQTKHIATLILQNKGIVKSIRKSNVGIVRQSAANFALKRYQGNYTHCWLANTDADCVVPSNWLNKQLVCANRGIQAIAGIVQVDSFEEHQPSAEQRFKNNYPIYHNHPHIHGANLGVRADAYLRVGGWQGLSTGEDHNLWERLVLLNIPMTSDANIVVTTSGRRVGRAPQGFADALNHYDFKD